MCDQGGGLAPDTLVITADDDIRLGDDFVLELVLASEALEQLPRPEGVAVSGPAVDSGGLL